jgi:DNA-binding CsgD family transcriptional regulator
VGVDLAEVIGRDEELAAIRDFLDDRDARVLVLEGKPGIGKTTLWQAGVELARGREQVVLSTQPTNVEASLSLTGLGDLLRSLPRDGWSQLPSTQTHAIAAALAEEDASPTTGGHVLAVAFLNLLRLSAENGPVLLAIDDLQWLDAASAAVVVFALRRVTRERIRLLAACRGDVDDLPLDLARCLPEQALRRLPIGPLSEGAIRRMLHRRLGVTPSRTLSHALHETAGGNPFYALELARAGPIPDAGGRVRLPRNLQALVRGQLAGLPDETRDALLHVAALADPTEDLVGELCGRSSLEPALARGIVELDRGRLRFRHSLVAAAVWGEAGPEQRRRVHASLAGIVDDLEQRARHSALAASSPDADVASLLEQAAHRASERGSPAAAAELIESARELTPQQDITRWARLTARAAALSVEAGPVERTAQLVSEAQLRLPPGPERAAILVAGGPMQPQSRDLCLQAIEEAGETPAGVLARIVLSAQSAFAGRWRESVEVGEEACLLARRIGVPGLLAAALTALTANELFDSRPTALRHLDEAFAIERRLGALPAGAQALKPEWWQARGALWRDDPDTARPLLEGLLQQAVDHGDESGVVQVAGVLSEVELHAGRWARADALADQALELSELLAYPHGRACVLTFRSRIVASRGEIDRAQAMADEALPILASLDDAIFGTLLQSALLFIALCRGDAAAALAHAEAVSRVFQDGRESWWTYHQGDELEALVLAGQCDRALSRAETLRAAGAELGSSRFLAWAERGAGLAHASLGDLAAAQGSLELALAHHERLDLPFELARTQLVYGSVLRRGTHRHDARAALGEALRTFDELGAQHFATVARAELGRVGGRTPAANGALTETEERVARLVAGGMSNRQVAERLVVTLSAVEATLTRVYAKLGISSRSQLVRARPELAGETPAVVAKNGVAGG